MRLFSPRKTTLLFVIRDKTKVQFSFLCHNLKNFPLSFLHDLIVHFFPLACEQTPLENLEPVLREDIQKVHVI